MKTFTVPLSAVAALFVVALGVLPAQALLFQTWVASNGNDANPCTRLSPCATFHGGL